MTIAAPIPYLAHATRTGGIAAIIIPIYGMKPRANVNNPHKTAKLMSKINRIAETPIP